jgi:hypothetical protein
MTAPVEVVAVRMALCHPDRPAFHGNKCKECRREQCNAAARKSKRRARAARANEPKPRAAAVRREFRPRVERAHAVRFGDPPQPIHAVHQVQWDADLSALRRALPPGAAVEIGRRGVVVSLIGETHTFTSIDEALDWATDPARAWPAELSRGLDAAPRATGTRR